MPKTKRSAKPATKAAAELPDWLTKGTMNDMDYTLQVTCGCKACNIDAIYLTREEYLALKLHLATLREFPIAACKAAIDDDEEPNNKPLKIHAA